MKKKSLNKNLNRAAIAKNDEFYTRLIDIEKELIYYKNYFKNKIIFCNCDNPKESNFFKYFALNFNSLGLKKLISTHYIKGKKSYKLEIIKNINNNDTIKTNLKGDGDFRSKECINILKETDIIVTNPPFSLFREYIAQLIEYKKSFIVIGSQNSISYKEIFPLIRKNQIWIGNTRPKEFVQPEGTTKKFGNICWYTNIDIVKKYKNIILYKTYKNNEFNYPKYNNYNAIEISKIKEIPKDYNGIMGVPITFIEKYNPEQFQIIGCDYDVKCGYLPEIKNNSWKYKFDRGYINGKKIYARIFIKKI